MIVLFLLLLLIVTITWATQDSTTHSTSQRNPVIGARETSVNRFHDDGLLDAINRLSFEIQDLKSKMGARFDELERLVRYRTG